MIELVPIAFDEFLTDDDLREIKNHIQESESIRQRNWGSRRRATKLARQHDKRIRQIIDLARHRL